jgi:hypothetical protein
LENTSPIHLGGVENINDGIRGKNVEREEKKGENGKEQGRKREEKEKMGSKRVK